MDATKVDQKSTLLQLIAKTPAAQLPSVPEIAERFKKIFCIIHLGGNTNPKAMQTAEAFYEAEKFHFMKMVTENEKLAECTKMSLYGCWMDVAVSRLSFDPSYKHLYLVPFSHNVAKKGQPAQWEKRASLQISGYGELLLRQMQGQIKYADNPVLVYESDNFKYGTRNGSAFVDHESVLPRKSSKIVASYMKIIRPDDSVDYKVITQEDIERFKKFSKIEKDKDGNAKESKAWTDGEGGMWLMKCIKHAFKNYPKIRTGTYSSLATQTEDVKDVEVVKSENEAKSSYVAHGEKASIIENVYFEEAEEVNEDEFAQAPAATERFVKRGDDQDEF